MDLKPCPFCGRPDPFIQHYTEPPHGDFNSHSNKIGSSGFQVVCLECGAAGGKAGRRIGAARMWNERAEEMAMQMTVDDLQAEVDQLSAELDQQKIGGN